MTRILHFSAQMRLILVSQLHDTHILNFARVFNQALPSCIGNFKRFVIFGPICWHLCTWESWTWDCQRTFNGKCNVSPAHFSNRSLDIIIPWIVFSKMANYICQCEKCERPSQFVCQAKKRAESVTGNSRGLLAITFAFSMFLTSGAGKVWVGWVAAEMFTLACHKSCIS